IVAAARGLRACRDAQAAVALLESALPYFLDSPAVLEELAAAYAEVGHAQQAAETLQRIRFALERTIAADPANPRLWSQLGSTYRRLRRAEQSEAAYSYAATLAPENPDAQFRVAVARYEAGRTANAQRVLTQLLSRWPQHTAARAFLSRIETPLVADIG